MATVADVATPYRALLVAAGQAALQSGIDQLTPGWLRFTLEYAAPPEPAAEKRRIADLLDDGTFEFFNLPPQADPLIYILQFPGVERRQSAGFLFAVADFLVDALALNSCTPDVDPGWIATDELVDIAVESVGDIVWALCKSTASPPRNHAWAVHAIKANLAWSRFATQGEGIVIGQPDTGVADHRELDDAIALDKGTDILAGGGKPIDPLAQSMANPGHGTATSSVVVSRSSLKIAGSAPAATLVPIRCIDSVVIGAGSAVAAAIDHARLGGCDVVTMSLGGPIAGAALRRAIQRSVDSGMIVLAAAGNCAPFVVYPAWDENVIAVAGTDVGDRPWKGTSKGAKVDISAPAENVHVARRMKPTDMDKARIEPGQGTSFAVALAAGCAALWLSHHTRPAVRAEADRRGIPVQQLFRAAAIASARKPRRWNTARMGAGIVNAEALLALQLEDIPVLRPAPGAHPGEAVLTELTRSERFSAEVGYLAFDRARRASPRGRLALENALPPTISPGLAKALAGAPRAARRLSARPHLVPSPLTPHVGPSEAARFLGGLVPATVEGGGPPTESAIRTYVRGTGKREIGALFEGLMARYDPAKDARPDIGELRQAVVTNIEPVLDGLARTARSSADFTGLPRIAAEALIELVGRPALRTRDGMIDPADPQLGSWAGLLATTRTILAPLVRAIGRIDVEIDGEHRHIGSGALIGDGLVATNRHVIEAFTEPLPGKTQGERFILARPASISFDDEPTPGGLRFIVRSVAAAGPAAIGRIADVGKLDLAVLEIETTNSAGRSLPAPLTAAGPLGGGDGAPALAIVGYPASPPPTAAIDPDSGAMMDKIWDRLWEIFQNQYGVRYLSPGRVKNAPGTIAGDLHRWAFSHDATTLAGNSGAPVIRLDGPIAVCGLHFGGLPLRQNLAHDLSAVAQALAGDPSLMDVAAFGGFLR